MSNFIRYKDHAPINLDLISTFVMNVHSQYENRDRGYDNLEYKEVAIQFKDVTNKYTPVTWRILIETKGKSEEEFEAAVEKAEVELQTVYDAILKHHTVDILPE